MDRSIFKPFRFLNRRFSGKSDEEVGNGNRYQAIPQALKDVKEFLECEFSGCDDFIMREISVGKGHCQRIIIAFIDGLVNKQLINSDIIKPLLQISKYSLLENEIKLPQQLHIVKERLLNACALNEELDLRKAVDGILSGNTLLFFDGGSTAINVALKDWEKRNIVEPTTDAVVRGPKEGFSETLRTNTSLLRRKIKNTNLKFETTQVGEQTHTDICICYIKGLANDDTVKTVKQRLKSIKIDAVLESGYIEEFIEDARFSIFPTVGNSEKPDIVAAKLLEGRVAVLCDGTPFVLTVPYLFVEAIQSSEDYYSRPAYSLFMRLTRITALFITMTFPAIYVAVVCFHQSIIPYKLLLTMSASREGIPFSPLIEALIMVITFELLREAGVRMPRAIGQAVSIVGALVIGDAAVKAGLVSTPMVIVIAITAISSFIVSSLAGTLLIVRLILMFASNILGILGILLVSIAFFIHMCTITSFGVPYLTPFTPVSGMDLKDTFVRFPLWSMLTRPEMLTWEHNEKTKFRTQGNGDNKKGRNGK